MVDVFQNVYVQLLPNLHRNVAIFLDGPVITLEMPRLYNNSTLSLILAHGCIFDCRFLIEKVHTCVHVNCPIS